jgi:hypothetical protein
MTASHQTLNINRTTFSQTQMQSYHLEPLRDGEALLEIKRFALTANNVTYAVYGDIMAYWNFFPSGVEGFGRVPVWGFADVIESHVEGLAVGTRVYGYLPMSNALKVVPTKVSAIGFLDAAPHRQAMAAVYNRYEIFEAQDIETESRIALLKPLFITGFLLDDWISSEKAWGATHVIASSASSKTALSMAACIKRRGNVKITGFTSARAKAFVEASGYYDNVVTYDDLGALGGSDAVYVDFAGDSAVTRGVHELMGHALKQSIIVGGSHWDAASDSAAALPGPKRELFFAPTHLARLSAQWGGGEFGRAVNAALGGFIHDSKAWLDVHENVGLEAAQASWARLLSNDVPAREGIVISL